MSLTIPGRRRQHPKHKASERLSSLEIEYRRIKAVVAGADAEFIRLRHRAAEAEIVADCTLRNLEDVTEERDALAAEVAELKDRLAPLEAAEANRQAVTVPPMVRDTSDGADQNTTPIDVRTLRERFAAGPVLHLHHSPQATDPAHIPQPAA